MATVLNTRDLNRATLARQLLLERRAVPALEVVERVAGFQAQAPWAPYYNLWTRIDGFDHDELARLLTERQVVRIALMRSTVHLVSAADCLMMRPLLQPVNDRWLRTAHRATLADLDVDALVAAGRALIEEQPLTMAELGAALAAHPEGAAWQDRAPDALVQVIRGLVPLVQVPPRGIWGVGGLTRVTSAEHWLGRPLDEEPSLETLVLRYLAGYGPASVKDVQTWSGLTRLKPVLEGLRSRLAVFRDEEGRELFDLPDAPRPGGDTVAPARFLGEFDNMLLSYADRTRIMSPETQRRLFNVKNGVLPRTFLIDGFVRGTWKVEEAKGSAVLRIEPYTALTAEDAEELVEEGRKLLDFAVSPDGGTREVQMATVD